MCGVAKLVMCAAEVPFFFYTGPLVKVLGVRAMVAVAQAAYITRLAYYSVSRGQSPLLLRQTPYLARVTRERLYGRPQPNGACHCFDMHS